MSSGSFVSERIAGADDMEEIIKDYNKMYGTSFSLQNFRAYYDDVNLRLKRKSRICFRLIFVSCRRHVLDRL